MKQTDASGRIGMLDGKSYPYVFRYSEIDESKLSTVERLGLAYCRLNSGEWDELVGPKPEGWDKMPDYDYNRQRTLYPTKADYQLRSMQAIENIIGKAEVSRCHWRFELGKTEEEWLAWYLYEGCSNEMLYTCEGMNLKCKALFPKKPAGDANSKIDKKLNPRFCFRLFILGGFIGLLLRFLSEKIFML